MICKPEGESFLAKRASKSENPTRRLGFLLAGKKIGPNIYEILPKHFSDLLRAIS
jgi:hypothetical protein